jgi:hypothetical protein
MRIRSIGVVLASALLASGCTVSVNRGGTGGDDAIVAEARAFMASYATDLLAGNREAIVARYDPRGAYVLGDGRKALESLDALRATYMSERWQPPQSFRWVDLDYEPLSRDAVAVVGGFEWGGAARAPVRFSYSGVLVRRDGALRIRIEDESGPSR